MHARACVCVSVCAWQADDCLLPALVSRTPIVFLCGSRKKKKKETPEIAPLHTDPVTLTAPLSEAHTRRQTHTQAHTHNPCISSPSDTRSARSPCCAACRHLSAHTHTGSHACLFKSARFPLPLRDCVCVLPASLRRLCGDS